MSEAVTSDGGYIIGGYFNNIVNLGNNETLTSNGGQDGMLVKYSAEGEVEWAKTIGGSETDTITSLEVTSDEGYIVGGYFKSATIDLGNGIKLTNNGKDNGMLIKYSAEGEEQWAKSIGGNSKIGDVLETSDKGYIVQGTFAGSLKLENGIILTSKNWMDDAMIIKYRNDGVIEWAKSIGGSGVDQINSVAEIRDGGYIVGISMGHNSNTIYLEEGVALYNNGGNDGYLIKYNREGELQWTKVIGGTLSDYIELVIETSDGGFLAKGFFKSSSIDLGCGVTLINNSNTGADDGMLIKYSAEGEVEWAKSIGGNSKIGEVLETSDKGYIVVGGFGSDSIDLGNEVIITNNPRGGFGDGMIIKYNAQGEVEWADTVGGAELDDISHVVETSDGGYLAGGICRGPVVLENGEGSEYYGDYDGMFIKYRNSGEMEWIKIIGGSKRESIERVAETSDGGYIVRSHFECESIKLENGETLTNNGSQDGMIIKYMPVENTEVIVEQAVGIGGNREDEIICVQGTKDGGYIAGGYFKSSSIDLGNGIILIKKSSNTTYSEGMLIKYNSIGEVEWAQTIGATKQGEITSIVETKDGGYIVAGDFESSSINLGNGVILKNSGSKDGMVIKYSKAGYIEWAKSIGGTSGDDINSIAETRDGGYIVVGYFKSSSIDLGNGVTLTNNGSNDGMIIKYSAEGEIEWAKSLGGTSDDYIESVEETRDGNYVVGGCYNSTTVDLGNGVTLTNNGGNDGMIIKYSAEGEVEWAKEIGGSGSDVIKSVAVASDGGYIVGGYFRSIIIDLGQGTRLTNNGNENGMLIKYSAEGEIEWAKEIGGILHDGINSVAETRDRGYIVGGYFHKRINLENGGILASNGSNDGMIVKYNSEGKIEWAKSIGGASSEGINSVAETIDGNYVAGGYFWDTGGNLNLGNGVILNKKGYSDGMVVKVSAKMGAPEVQELVVENERKEYRITTDVNEIDGIKGGSISGEDKSSYEKVKYGDNSTKEIIMIPEENYEIIGITINGEEYGFAENEDG